MFKSQSKMFVMFFETQCSLLLIEISKMFFWTLDASQC